MARPKRHPIETRAVLWHGARNGKKVVKQLNFAHSMGNNYIYRIEVQDVHKGLKEAKAKVRLRDGAVEFENNIPLNEDVKLFIPFNSPIDGYDSPRLKRSRHDRNSEMFVVELQLKYSDKDISDRDTQSLGVAP